MTVKELEKLFSRYSIQGKKPDIIVIDKEEGDNKIIFFKKPKGLNKVAVVDKKRKKGTYYTINKPEGLRMCYPVVVDMYEYKDIVSGDDLPTDLWIGSEEDINLQIVLALKKEDKREIYDYKTFKE